jgi:RHS repeat-associated protein
LVEPDLKYKDYYPFGAPMPGRNFNSQNYRFGFNGKEMDNEITNVTGSHLDFGARIYDSRIGRFLSVDPWTSKYPWQTSYAYHRNSPITYIDWMGFGDPEDLSKATSDAVETMSEKYGESMAVCNFGAAQAFENFTGKKDLWGKTYFGGNVGNLPGDDDNLEGQPDDMKYYFENSSEWTETTMDKAQGLANEGKFVVAVDKGHIAVAVPADEDELTGNLPMVMDTGGNKRTAKKSVGWSWRASDLKTNVKWFVYEPPEENSQKTNSNDIEQELVQRAFNLTKENADEFKQWYNDVYLKAKE